MPIINNIMIFVHRFAHKKLKKKIFKLFWFKGCLWPRKCDYIYMQLLEPINLTKMYKVLRSILKLNFYNSNNPIGINYIFCFELKTILIQNEGGSSCFRMHPWNIEALEIKTEPDFRHHTHNVWSLGSYK